MIKFPVLVYKSPGFHKKPKGGTYNYVGVNSQEELDEKLLNGWFENSAQAIEAAGDKANGPQKIKSKFKLKPQKKKKPAKPLNRVKKETVKVESVKFVEPEIIIDNTPPTRAELKLKANELGLVFDGRMSDKNLGKLIQDKLLEIARG